MAVTDPRAPRVQALRLLSDERLAKMAEAGSTGAFAAIYARHAPALHAYCRSLVRHEADAGDALQNAMTKALTALRAERRTGPLKPWLFRIAHNESVTVLRQRSRRPDALDDVGEQSGLESADVYREVEAREGLAEVLDDLGRLTQHQRSALVMRGLAGMDYDEIAEALGTSPLAARQAVFVARKALLARGDARVHRRLRLLLPPVPVLSGLGASVLGGAGSAATGVALVPKVAATAALCVGIGGVGIATEERVHRGTVQAAAAATPAATPAPVRARPVATPVPTAAFASVAATPAPTAPAAKAAEPETTRRAAEERDEDARPRRRERGGTGPDRDGRHRHRHDGDGDRDGERTHRYAGQGEEWDRPDGFADDGAEESFPSGEDSWEPVDAPDAGGHRDGRHAAPEDMGAGEDASAPAPEGPGPGGDVFTSG